MSTITPGSKVLFISGSIGLGHVTRDLAIATELRRRMPEIDLWWLAADPARQVIHAAGEKLLPESEHYADESLVLEVVAGNFSVNLMNPTYLLKFGAGCRELRRFVRAWRNNVELFMKTRRHGFDLVIGDETYEIAAALAGNPDLKRAPFVMIYDFIGFDAMTRNPLEHAAVYVANRWWAKLLERDPSPYDLILFVGEEEDVPDKPFGFRLPNRRARARAAIEFLGYVSPFDPAEYADRGKIRARLGYGDETLIVSSIGGTAIGGKLLELCARAYPIVKGRVPDLRMVLVCGPRLSPAALEVPAGVELRGYVPSLYEHFAACDLAIVQAGGTTTLELTALRRPFLYFPLEEHFEQQLLVAGRLARHGAGTRIRYATTTPESLAEAILASLGREVSYPPIPTDGARRAAELVGELLSRH